MIDSFCWITRGRIVNSNKQTNFESKEAVSLVARWASEILMKEKRAENRANEDKFRGVDGRVNYLSETIRFTLFELLALVFLAHPQV